MVFFIQIAAGQARIEINLLQLTEYFTLQQVAEQVLSQKQALGQRVVPGPEQVLNLLQVPAVEPVPGQDMIPGRWQVPELKQEKDCLPPVLSVLRLYQGTGQSPLRVHP
jgi:hypothetical protein